MLIDLDEKNGGVQWAMEEAGLLPKRKISATKPFGSFAEINVGKIYKLSSYLNTLVYTENYVFIHGNPRPTNCASLAEVFKSEYETRNITKEADGCFLLLEVLQSYSGAYDDITNSAYFLKFLFLNKTIVMPARSFLYAVTKTIENDIITTKSLDKTIIMPELWTYEDKNQTYKEIVGRIKSKTLYGQVQTLWKNKLLLNDNNI